MRPLYIKAHTGKSGWKQLKASWSKNYIHYLQEALGLAIFMASACFFGAVLESPQSSIHHFIPDGEIRIYIMGLAMGGTAYLIFNSPVTAGSGAHINPAVSVTYYRLGRMCHWDLIFYILFQIIGGTLTVYLMQCLLGDLLTGKPVSSVATTPGIYGTLAAFIIEIFIAFITMYLILVLANEKKWQQHLSRITPLFVCCWVIIAGPVSGFGMNPARSIASAIPSGIWTAWWIYLFAPFAGMLLAAELYLLSERKAIYCS